MVYTHLFTQAPHFGVQAFYQKKKEFRQAHYAVIGAKKVGAAIAASPQPFTLELVSHLAIGIAVMFYVVQLEH